LDRVSKEYKMGREKEYEINEKLKITKKEDLDWSIGQWTYYMTKNDDDDDDDDETNHFVLLRHYCVVIVKLGISYGCLVHD